MLTIHDVIKDITNINEGTLAKLSDQIWSMGDIHQIKEKLNPELFLLHISINMIGNWKCEGWWGIISEQAELVPYIPNALKALNLNRLKAVFKEIIAIFPTYTIFSNDESNYYDIINFLQNIRFKVEDELNHIPLETRKEMVQTIKKKLDQLEDLSEPLWGYGAELDGWKQVIDYIKINI